MKMPTEKEAETEIVLLRGKLFFLWKVKGRQANKSISNDNVKTYDIRTAK